MATLIAKRKLPLCIRQTLPVVSPCRNLSLTASNRSKIYELRTYTLQPAHFREYLELVKEKFHMRTAHSKLYGFWMTELGGLNEVNHIWEYDSFAHRTKVRQDLATDPVWTGSFLSQFLPIVDKQENALLLQSPLKQVEDSPVKEGGVYELCRYRAKPGSETPLMQALLNRAELIEGSGSGKLMGLFSTDVGDNTSVYHLWNYESMDKRRETISTLSESPKDNTNEVNSHVTSMSNKVMLPSPVSPLK